MPTHASFNPHDLLNQTIGDYQLCELLGAGNAFVYRALDKGKGEYVALKLVSWPGAPVDDMALRRFAREIRVLRERHHAAIVPIYDWHPTGDYVYVTMEYCEGTLARWLREHRPTLTEVLQIAEPLAAALDFLHAGPPPVLHRDLKPANILFKGRNWYLSDFSIARMEADQFVTTDGTTLGTLRYAAPEQITGAKLSAETDVYSFGLVVYEMLAGGWVLGARRQPDWDFEVPPISRFQRGLSPAVDDLFYRWLAPRPADRPHRAGDAVRELAAAAGILRNPALARLYDLATALAGRPHDPPAWSQARDLLAAIALHEPAFFDPRGLAAELESRQDGRAPGPPPPGYSGTRPLDFYSEKTVFAPSGGAGAGDADPAAPGEADGDDAPAAEPPPARLLPAGDAGAATFAPRSRYDAAATLYVPASMAVAGSVFGRKVVVEAGAHIAGDIYSLGDLTLGARAEVGGAVLAGGALRADAGARVGGAAGAQATTVQLGAGAQLRGWVMAGGALAVAPGVGAAGLLAGGPLAFAGPVEIAAASVASAGGGVDLQAPVRLGGVPAVAEQVQRWTLPGTPAAAGAASGHLLSSLLTRRARELAEEAQGRVATPAALAAPRPVVAADEPSLETTPATEGPTLYLPAALRLDPAAPPAGLPAEGGDWEGALAGAWLLDRLWAGLLRPARLLALGAGLGTLLCVGVVLWLALAGLAGTAGQLLLAWFGLLAVAAGVLWLLRPRPLELVRLWWAWETWSQAGGVLLWDTLDPGTPPGYLEPDAPLEPLGALAGDVAAAGDDTAILEGLATLTKTLERLPWKSWPGVFASRPAGGVAPDAPAAAAPSAATELLHLPVEMLPEEMLPHMRVLVPRLDPEFVRAGADRLAAWPAYLTGARALWRAVAGHLGVLDPLLDRWDVAAAAAAEGAAAARTGLATQRARATALAEETLGALEGEVAPEIDQLWTLHVDGTKLIGAYYAHALDARRVIGRRDQDRAASRVAAGERELRRCESALAEVDAELRPLADRWPDLGATHERVGADLRREWKRARAQMTRADEVGEPFVAARPIDVRQAAALVPQLARDANGLVHQGEELTAAAAKDERDWPLDLPWPAWPARITVPLAMDAELTALDALLRKLRGEPARARTRLDTLRSLLAKITLALERALGAQEALAQAIAAAGADPLGEPGRLAGLETQADGLVRRLRPLLADLTRRQRRVELNTVAYAEVVDLLSGALKGGRSGPTWEQGARLQADYRRLAAELATTTGASEQARLALAAAQDDLQRGQAETETALLGLAGAEQDLVGRSEAQATQEETALRRHIAGLRARHDAVLAGLAPRDSWLEALAATDATGSRLKGEAAEHLRERIQILAAFADGRIAETAEARAAALWPVDLWPAGDMLYLVPVWLLRYRPLGWRRPPRLLALPPGRVCAAPRARRLRPAAGFAVEVQPGLAARFAADILTWANAGPGVPAPLAGANLLAPGAGLAGAWRTLAAGGLVPPWLARLLAFL